MHLHTRFTFEYIDLKLKKKCKFTVGKESFILHMTFTFFCVFAEL